MTAKIQKSAQSAEIRVVLGGSWVTQGNWQQTIRQSTYDFLFDFNRNYVPILYHFHCPKLLNLTYPTSNWHPHWR